MVKNYFISHALVMVLFFLCAPTAFGVTDKKTTATKRPVPKGKILIDGHTLEYWQELEKNNSKKIQKKSSKKPQIKVSVPKVVAVDTGKKLLIKPEDFLKKQHDKEPVQNVVPSKHAEDSLDKDSASVEPVHGDSTIQDFFSFSEQALPNISNLLFEYHAFFDE